MRLLKPLAALLAASALGACSSVIEGTSQEIFVSTNPDSANCNFIREGKSIARVATTPGSVTIKKTKHDMVIECEKDGFHKSVYHNKSGAAAATFGNIILGGGIGWAIDSASGADNKYTSPVNITLVPKTMPAPAPVYSNEQERKAQEEGKPTS